MCFNEQTILVPQELVKAMLDNGATCGACEITCCPDQTGDKIDMCLNGKTINVSRNACKGILNAGGTCGPCEKIEAEEPIIETATVKPDDEISEPNLGDFAI